MAPESCIDTVDNEPIARPQQPQIDRFDSADRLTYSPPPSTRSNTEVQNTPQRLTSLSGRQTPLQLLSAPTTLKATLIPLPFETSQSISITGQPAAVLLTETHPLLSSNVASTLPYTVEQPTILSSVLIKVHNGKSWTLKTENSCASCAENSSIRPEPSSGSSIMGSSCVVTNNMITKLRSDSDGDSSERTGRKKTKPVAGVVVTGSNREGTFSSEQLARQRAKEDQRRERKTAKILAIITGVFIVCWLPFFALTLLKLFVPVLEKLGALYTLFLWLGWANSMLVSFQMF